jgi:hypothetical protein
MAKARVLSLKQMRAKTYKFLEDLPQPILDSFGNLTNNFSAIIYGNSGNGKSSMIMQIVVFLLKYGKVFYVALEEGHAATMQTNIIRHIPEEIEGGISFADHNMDYDQLCARLHKRNSGQFIIIDSIQYMRISYEQFQSFKKKFPRKCFIYISHSNGNKPSGKLACDIEYDVDLKIQVKGYLGFVRSRLKDGVSKPFVIWEQGARKFWGTQEYRKLTK